MRTSPIQPAQTSFRHHLAIPPQKGGEISRQIVPPNIVVGRKNRRPWITRQRDAGVGASVWERRSEPDQLLSRDRFRAARNGVAVDGRIARHMNERLVDLRSRT